MSAARLAACALLAMAAAGCRGGLADSLKTQDGSDGSVASGGASGGSPRAGGALTGSPVSPGGTGSSGGNTTLPGNPNAANPNTTDPNTAPGGASGCPATAQSGSVCDGFEDAAAGGPPDGKRWRVETANPTSTVTIDATRAARGQQSVHVHTANGGYERAVIVNTSIFPAPQNTFWGRAFFFVQGTVPQAHFTLIAGADVPASAGAQPTWVRYGGQFGHFIANWFGNDAAQHAAVNVNGQWTMAALVPADRWVCLEWQFKGDTNELHLWQDGNAIDRLSIVGTASDSPGTTWTAPTYGQVQLGWEIYGNAGADAANTGYDVWVDEVALGPARITCGL